MQEPRTHAPAPDADPVGDGAATAPAVDGVPAGLWALASAWGGWITAGLWALARGVALVTAAPTGEAQGYFDAAGRLLAGSVPFRDFPCPVAPATLAFVAVPRLFTHDLARYCHLLSSWMLVADAAVMALVWHTGAHLGGARAPAGTAASARRAGGAVATGIYLAATAPLGSMLVERAGLVAAAPLAAWLWVALTRRPALWGDAALGLGAGTGAVALVPVWLAWRGAALSGRARTTEVVRRLGGVVAFAAAAMAPAWPAGAGALWGALAALEPGLQPEGLWGSLVAGPVRALGGPQVATILRLHAPQLDHPAAQALFGVAHALWALAALALGAWAWRAFRGAGAAPQDERLEGRLVLVTCTQVAASLALGWSFPPQSVLLLAPLLPAAVGVGARDARLAAPGALAGWLAVVATTALVWLAYTQEVANAEPMAVSLLLARNAMVAAVAHSLWRALAGAWARLCAHRGWLVAACLLGGIWVFFANLSETTANDIWIQMRTGGEIFATGRFPDREAYTLTVLGRPFIAHEWLSSVLFFVAVQVMGEGGLSFTASAVALGAAVMVWFSVPRGARGRRWWVPAWLACNYLISFRMLMRPHIFTILAQCGLSWGMEAWRRRGGWRPLWPFVPMQLLWVNLHGGAFFGPAFVFMFAGVVGLMVMVPGLQAGSEPRRLAWRDVGQLVAVGAAMSAVCLVNPYGTTLLSWSLDLLGNDYAKQRVWEWTSPFLRMPGQAGLSNRHYYWLWLYLAHMLALWAAIAVRLRRLPLLDIAVAAVVTVLSVRANRFVPEMAIFSLPIFMRGMEAVVPALVPARAMARSAWLELSVVGLLLANLATYGYAHSANEHRPRIGWGFGGDMPYQEVALLKKLGATGRIFNEYSDGALIIHDLVPSIRPVLDSRIDLYPLEVVGEYDRAYRGGAQLEDFRRYVTRHDITHVMLMRGRASPQLLQGLARDPEWELLSSIRQRLLFGRLTRGARAPAGAPRARDGKVGGALGVLHP